MRKEIDQLKETLIKEDDMYQEILTLEKEKTDIIRKGKLLELETMTKKEQQFLMMMGTFERIRRSVFTNAAQLLGVENLESLSEFLLYLEDENEINEIDELRNNILEKIKELKEVNELNQQLLEKHLEYVQFSLEIITSQVKDNNYGNKAQGKNKGKSNLFDARI